MKRFLLAIIFCFFVFNSISDGAMVVRLNNAPIQISVSDPRIIWMLNKGEEIEVSGLNNDFYSITYKGNKGFVYKNYLSQQSNGEVYENLESQFKDVFRNASAEKAQIAVIRGGQLTGTYAYNCSEDDKFEVFALSKTVLGILAAKMDQDGIIDLDQTIDKYWYALADLNFNTCSQDWNSYVGNASTVKTEVRKQKIVQNPATLRNCLTHSSTVKQMSMVNYNSVEHTGEYFGGSIGKSFATAAFMLGHTSNQLFNPLSEGAPGTKTQYNKDKDGLTREHALAGYTMQAAAHVSINEYLRDNILNPLGIYTEPQFKKEGMDGSRKIDGSSMYYAAGYQSSAKDLAKIIALVASGGEYNGIKILDSNAIREIEKVEPNLNYQTIAFNYNNGKFERDGMFSGISGFNRYDLSQTGWNSYLSYDPNTGDGFVVTAYGTKCNSQTIYDAARNYTYAF